MAVSLGAVAAALLTVGNAPTQVNAASGAQVAKLLGAVLMPVAIAFAIYSGWLYYFRRELLRKDDLFNPALHSTRIPLILGYLLCGSLATIFVLDLLGSLVHL